MIQVPWAEWERDVETSINLDGESIKTNKIRLEVVPGAIKLVPREKFSMIESCS